MKDFFVILGGMGTMASESFVHVLNKRTVIHRDQDFLNYLLVNHATVPDRTAFILGESTEDPRQALIEDIKQYTPLAPAFFVVTCNTAHYFYDELAAATPIPVLHMPRLTVQKISASYADQKIRVGLLATTGTIQSGVYRQELDQYDKIETVLPSQPWQEQIMSLIYRDIKEHNYLNHELYIQILTHMIYDQQCDICLLGCTELSLMQENSAEHGFSVIDAQSVLVDETLRLGLESQKNK